MNHSTTRTTKRYAAFLLAGLFAACTPDPTGVTGSSAGDDARTSTGVGSSRGINLGTASDFVILAKTGISTVPQSAITGNIGVSPISRGGLTGFDETMDVSNTFSTATQVVGHLFAADYASPTASKLGLAVLDMQAAYTDAAGRAPDFTELGTGNIGGLTLSPGTYKWGTSVLIPSDVTLNGSSQDVWIFQISGGVKQASGTRVILTGGALARNVYWQVADVVAIGTTAHMEGVILAQTAITLATGATVTGRLLAQTAVTLQMNAVTQP